MPLTMAPCCLWALDASASLMFLSAAISATHRLWLPFSDASDSCLLAPLSLCCHLLSTSAFTSASSCTSAYRRNSASSCAPPVLLVVKFYGASASPSSRASTDASDSAIHYASTFHRTIDFCFACHLTPAVSL